MNTTLVFIHIRVLGKFWKLYKSMVTILLFFYVEKTLEGQWWYDLVEKFQSLEIEIEWYKGDCYVLFALLGHDFVGKIKVFFQDLRFCDI